MVWDWYDLSARGYWYVDQIHQGVRAAGRPDRAKAAAEGRKSAGRETVVATVGVAENTEGGEAMSETHEVYQTGQLPQAQELERRAARAQQDDYAYAFAWDERAADLEEANLARREEHVVGSPKGYVGLLMQAAGQRATKREWANRVRELAGLPMLTPEDSDYAQE